MGRKRKSSQHLPPYVYIDGPSYVYRGTRPQCVIGRVDKTPLSKVWEWWERENDPERLTLRRLLLKYHDSKQFQRLKPRTQSDYLKYFERIVNTEGVGGRRFGDLDVADLNVKLMQAYLVLRDEMGAPVQGNREISYMQGAFRWAVPLVQGVDSNPCVGVNKNPEDPEAGRQYVETSRFKRAFELAQQKAVWYVAPMMVIAVACRARKIEILDLRKNDILPEKGLFMRRRKRSKDNIIEWSDALLWAVRTALEHHTGIDSVFLFHDKAGQPIKDSTFNTAWDRFQADHIAPAGIGRFKFHDLKRKGVSDDTGDWMAGSGHRSEAMGAIYRLKPQTAKPTL